MVKYPSVLHIIDSLEPGGAEKVAVMMANLFSKKGHKAGLMYFVPTPINLLDTVKNNVAIYHFDRKGKFNALRKLEFQKITSEYDLLHVHLKHNLRYVWFLKLFSKKIPLVFFHDHGFTSFNHLNLKVTKAALSNAVYLSVNESLSEIARKKLGVQTAHLLENTIETIEAPSKLSSDHNEYRLVLVSNIHPRKNIFFAIEYLSELVKKIDNCKLDIIGNVLDSEYFEFCMNATHRLGLSGNIKFIHGESCIQPLLVDYDMGLHVSPEETGPLVLLEYLVQGLPFLSYLTGQVSEKACQEFPEFFINNYEMLQWIESSKNIYNNLNTELAVKMQQFFKKDFSTSKFYEKCLNIYLKNLN